MLPCSQFIPNLSASPALILNVISHRAKKFVSHLHHSSKQSEEFRQLQREALLEGTSSTAGDVEEDEGAEETEDVLPGWEDKGRRPKQVLALRKAVDTRWNSLHFLVERCEQHSSAHAALFATTRGRGSSN